MYSVQVFFKSSLVIVYNPSKADICLKKEMEHLLITCLESRFETNRTLYSRFLLSPFVNGHAITIASALRRALLSDVEATAILAIEIQGVAHEYSTIAGVRESVLDISLNFQQIVLRSQNDIKTPQVGYLKAQGPTIVRAANLKLPVGVECVDPTQYIAQLSTEGLLVVKFLIGKGTESASLKRETKVLTAANSYPKLLTAKRIQNHKKRELLKPEFEREPEHSSGNRNYVPEQSLGNQKLNRVQVNRTTSRNVAPEEKPFTSDICFSNIIHLAPYVSPVHRVNYIIEKEDLVNQPRDRLLFEIWTNGSIHPRQAIHEAALSLIKMFTVFERLIHVDSYTYGKKRLKALSPIKSISSTKLLSLLYKTKLDKKSLLGSDLSNLSLPLNTYTSLKRAGVHKLETLLSYSPKELLQLLNGNKIMFYDIRRCLLVLGVHLKD